MFTTKPWNCRMDILSQCPMLGKKVRSISVCNRFTASFSIRSPFPSFPIKVGRKLLSGSVVMKSSVLSPKDQEAMYAPEDIAADELRKRLPSDTFYSLVDLVIIWTSIPMFLRFLKLSYEYGIWKDILNPILIWLGLHAARHFCNVIAPGITASKVFKQFVTGISITCLMSIVYQLKVHQFSDPVLLIAVASCITWYSLRDYIMVFHLAGNYIKCKSVEGRVISVGLISTKVYNSERKLVTVPNSVLRTEEVTIISEFHYQKVTITVTLNDVLKVKKVMNEIKGVILTVLRKYSDYLDNTATHFSVPSIDENILELVVGYGIREMTVSSYIPGYGIREMRSRKLQEDLNFEITLKLKDMVDACEDCESVKIALKYV